MTPLRTPPQHHAAGPQPCRWRRASARGQKGLTGLRRLILETLPSCDSSKVTQVDSLEPLRALPLEELNMSGVRPASRGVDELLTIPTLRRRVRLSKFAAKEIKRINEFVVWHQPSWGSAAEVEASGEPLPTGISFRTPSGR